MIRAIRVLFLILVAVSTVFLSSYSCTFQEKPQSLEEQARDIYRSLMCPLCPGQTIEQSQSELSAQMRAIVREKLEQGQTKEEILQFFVERYGESVLAAPEKAGFNLIVWVLPLSGILIGGIVLWIIIKRKVKDKSDTEDESSSPDDVDYEKYREQVEKDMKSFDERGFR